MKTILNFKTQFLLIGLSIFLYACNTTNALVSRKSLENKVLAEINQKGVSPNLLPGPCPYPCTDIRCKAYYNGYCGTSNDTIIIRINPNNPNDFVGAEHNTGCDDIMQEISLSSPTIWNDVLTDMKGYLNSSEYDTTQFNSWYNYAVSSDYYSMPDTIFTNNPDSLIVKLYSDGKITGSCKNYLTDIFNIIDNTIGNSTPSSTLYNSVAAQLITLENTIQSDNSLSSNEQSGLLAVCAIARYSGGYWGDYYFTENEGGASPSNSVNPDLFLHIHIHIHITWRKFWNADISGGISGFFGTLITGGGLIVGTLGGAVAGSVGEAVSENILPVN